MTDIRVRPMAQDDIGQAASIHKKIPKEGLTQDMEYSIEALFTAFIDRSPKTCLVAEDDDTVVGFIVGDIKEWSFGLERSGWIEIVEVDPKHMGKGIGKTLGEALLKSFREEGIREVYTSVKWDSGDLIEFFKSIGFDKSGFINLENKSN
ncbi:MAG: GNAT family N-acetyltransferase [Thermoplasmata archaeon]|nr:GNAT family N-acetyltransferase [Thermoplasmata archaeon]